MSLSAVRRAAVVLCASATLLAACEDENNDPVVPVEEGTILIDASTATAYRSFTDDGLVEVTSADSWDMSFRRFTVGLNGGVSGTKGVTAYNRVADTRTGAAAKREHQNRYDTCQEVCEKTEGEESCMVYVPFEKRYKHRPECLE
jgi:hypothetical protein